MLNKKFNSCIGSILLLAFLLPLFSGNGFSSVKKEDRNSVVFIIEEQSSQENLSLDTFKSLEKVKFNLSESFLDYGGLNEVSIKNYINRKVNYNNNFLLNPFILDIPPPALS